MCKDFVFYSVGFYIILHKYLRYHFKIINTTHICVKSYSNHGPIARYAKLWVAHAPGMFSRHHGLAITTCNTARVWRTCRGACRDRQLAVSFEVCGGENLPDIPGACTTCNFTYLVKIPWVTYYLVFLRADHQGIFSSCTYSNCGRSSMATCMLTVACLTDVTIQLDWRSGFMDKVTVVAKSPKTRGNASFI